MTLYDDFIAYNIKTKLWDCYAENQCDIVGSKETKQEAINYLIEYAESIKDK